MDTPHPWQLHDKHLLITGASKGIGLAIAREAHALGARLMLVARQAGALEELARTLPGSIAVAADVSHPAGRQTVQAAVAEHWGRLDGLFNNVGTNIRKATLDYTPADWQALMAANLESAWALSQAFFPLLAAAPDGHIVNISSVAATRAIRSSTAAYAMSKAAMNQMTAFLACEWGGQVRVNAIAPWYTRTPLAEQVLQDPDKRAGIIARTPMGRIGEPEEVARAACFLAMPAAAYITGQVLAVDGGFSALGF